MSILAFLFGTKLGRSLVGGVAALLALAALYAGITHHAYNRGWDRALSQVKTQDATAKGAADAAQLTVDQCYAKTGYVWSVVTGECQKDAP